MKKYKGSYVFVQYCVTFGRIESPARQILVEQNAEGDGVNVILIVPGKRTSRYIKIMPNARWATIEQDGAVVWDSRDTVPCDMAKWNERRAVQLAAEQQEQ